MAMKGVPDSDNENLAKEVIALERRHRVYHDLEGKKNEAESENSIPDALIHPVFGKKNKAQPDADQQKRIIGDVKSDELHGKRCADVRAENDGQRLAEAHEPGADKAHEHD